MLSMWGVGMTDPLEIMDEIESDQARVVALVPNGCLIVTAPEWQSLRAAIEQQQARIAELEHEYAGPAAMIASRALFELADYCQSEQERKKGTTPSYRNRMRRCKQVSLWFANRKKDEADRIRSEAKYSP